VLRVRVCARRRCEHHRRDPYDEYHP